MKKNFTHTFHAIFPPLVPGKSPLTAKLAKENKPRPVNAAVLFEESRCEKVHKPLALFAHKKACLDSLSQLVTLRIVQGMAYF